MLTSDHQNYQRLKVCCAFLFSFPSDQPLAELYWVGIHSCQSYSTTWKRYTVSEQNIENLRRKTTQKTNTDKLQTISNFHVVTSYLWSVVSCLYGELYLLSLLRLLSFLPSLKYFNKRRQIIILTHQLYAEDNILSSLILGTSHYLCRAGEEGKKEGGGGSKAISDWLEGGGAKLFHKEV